MRKTLRQVAECLAALHRKGFVHGEVEMKKFGVRSSSRSGKFDMKLIDTDSCVQAKPGQTMRQRPHRRGSKLPPNAGAPPEHMKRILDGMDSNEPEPEPGSGPELPAEKSLDMWGFGLMVYKLCTSGTHFCIEDGSGDLVRQKDKVQIAHHWHASKLKVTEDIKWPWARDLALWCLQDKPERRPKSFEEVLRHPFLDTKQFVQLSENLSEFQSPCVAGCRENVGCSCVDGGGVPPEASFAPRAPRRAVPGSGRIRIS